MGNILRRLTATAAMAILASWLLPDAARALIVANHNETLLRNW